MGYAYPGGRQEAPPESDDEAEAAEAAAADEAAADEAAADEDADEASADEEGAAIFSSDAPAAEPEGGDVEDEPLMGEDAIFEQSDDEEEEEEALFQSRDWEADAED